MNTIRLLFWESTRSVRFVTVLVSLLGALGVYLRNDDRSGDVHLLLHTAPWWVWSGALSAIALHRYWCLWWSAVCHSECLETIPGALASAVAIFVWSMLLASAAVASDFGLGLMILVCCVCETWLLSRHWLQLRERLRKK